MKLPEQVTRLGIVIAAIVAVVLLLRFVILPATMAAMTMPRRVTCSGSFTAQRSHL